MPEVNETYSHDGIECPYCGYVEEDGEVIYDQDMQTFDCPRCDRSMNCEINITWNFSASERTVQDIEDEIKLETENGLRILEVSVHARKSYEGRNPYQHKIDRLEKEKVELLDILKEEKE